VAVDRDEPAVAAETGQDVVQQLVYRLLECEPTVLDRIADVVGGDCADEILTVPGGRYRTHAVLRVRTGADDRRVADPPRPLVAPATGGGCGGKIAPGVACHCAHRPLRRGGYEVRDALAALLGLELLETLGGAEIVVGDQREMLLQRELLGPRADEQHVAR